MLLNILAVGDVCGEGGQDILARRLRELKQAEDIHFTVVNGENASVVGITPRQARGLYDFLEKDRYILRPANFAGRVPGRGFGIYDGPQGLKIAVINLMGRLELNANLDSPFKQANLILRREDVQQCDVILVDFHAEATSEKGAMAWYLDGRVQAVWGTHTHVPTADGQVLPKGTGFLSDLGMTGPRLSILGVKPELSLNLFLGGLPKRYEEAEGPCKINACKFVIDSDRRRCVEVKRVDLLE